MGYREWRGGMKGEGLAAELAQDAVARWGIQKRQNLDQNSKKIGVLVKVLWIFCIFVA